MDEIDKTRSENRLSSLPSLLFSLLPHLLTATAFNPPPPSDELVKTSDAEGKAIAFRGGGESGGGESGEGESGKGDDGGGGVPDSSLNGVERSFFDEKTGDRGGDIEVVYRSIVERPSPSVAVVSRRPNASALRATGRVSTEPTVAAAAVAATAETEAAKAEWTDTAAAAPATAATAAAATAGEAARSKIDGVDGVLSNFRQRRHLLALNCDRPRSVDDDDDDDKSTTGDVIATFPVNTFRPSPLLQIRASPPTAPRLRYRSPQNVSTLRRILSSYSSSSSSSLPSSSDRPLAKRKVEPNDRSEIGISRSAPGNGNGVTTTTVQAAVAGDTVAVTSTSGGDVSERVERRKEVDDDGDDDDLSTVQRSEFRRQQTRRLRRRHADDGDDDGALSAITPRTQIEVPPREPVDADGGNRSFGADDRRVSVWTRGGLPLIEDDIFWSREVEKLIPKG